MNELIAWIEGKGGHVGRLVVEGRGGEDARERGVFASADLAAGERLLVVPRTCFVTPDLAAEEGPGRWIGARYDGASVEQVLLAAWIVARRRAPDPRWAPFVATLPTCLPTHPFFHGEAERHALRGTSLETLVPARRAYLLEELGWIRGNVPGCGDWDDAEWLLARTLVTSRLFDLGGERALVPFADLFNHALTAGTAWGVEAEGFVLRAAGAVPAGAELHESYGPKSNLRLLLHYGFTLAQNPEEDCIVEVEGQPLQLGAAPDAAAVAEAVDGLAWDGDTARARRALARVCAARLAGLPGEDEDAADFAVARDAVRVRQAERRVLRGWVGRLG